MGWFRPKEKITKGDYQGVKKADKKKKCHWCGNKLKNNENYREPDNTQTILCKNCFDKAIDDLIKYGGTRVQSSQPVRRTYNGSSSDYNELTDREVSKKKFNAYQNPGIDEAEFRMSYKKLYGKSDKTEYEKGRDKVKRILDKKDEEDK